MAGTQQSTDRYDALFIVSFGGPEGMEDVIPFLENVLRGRNVPRERMLEVAHHYEMFGGVSPINQQVRDLIEVLRPAMDDAGVDLPIYWGNRNWTPYIPDAIAQMRKDGVRSALALVLSGYSSYSGCRQYRENIADGLAEIGSDAPRIDKIRVFYNHPLFVKANVERLQTAIARLPAEHRDSCQIAYTAHSLPQSMADTSDYVKQLQETARLVSEGAGVSPERWELVYQSRSGRPQDPWLEPDILDHLDALAQDGSKAVVIAPIGFLSDHMEVLFDLDEEAVQKCAELGVAMQRASTVGTHSDFVAMLVELIQERLDSDQERRAIGQYGCNHDVCPMNCCPPPRRPTSGSQGSARPQSGAS
ncbi:ferrochelatase [Rubinisphaera margarita]|uniref:ferrochelatase n=1 Tax=Rubinisphaera margarita TaxID=2909586 RepID=UPI001EE90C19|nr:ferrochelatase [Rubinisphaera margarita]MCG6157048.1 ferrochelatase [Rubinisphaera margarita]